jgi:hypothetical protein
MEGSLRAMTDVTNSYTTLDNVWAITVDVDGPTRFGRYFASQNSHGTPDAGETGRSRGASVPDRWPGRIPVPPAG